MLWVGHLFGRAALKFRVRAIIFTVRTMRSIWV